MTRPSAVTVKYEIGYLERHERIETASTPAHLQRSRGLVLGGAGVPADQWHHRAGASDSFRLDGKYVADRRSLDHESHRLRRRRAVHQLARAVVAQSAPPASDYFQAAVCSG